MATIAEAVALGLKYQQAGDLNQAEQIYRQILQANPTDADVLRLFGAVCQARGRSDEALASYEQAVRIRPNFVQAWHDLGNALRERGKLEEAAAAYQEVIRLKPDSVETLNNLGGMCGSLGRMEEATTYFQEAVRLRPDFVEAHCNLAVALVAVGRTTEAVASYRAALRHRPDALAIHWQVGNLLQAQSKLDEAAASYEEAVRLKPDFIEALNSLAIVRAAQGRRDEAVTLFRRVLGINPDLAEVHANLGNLLRELGKRDEAVASLQEALRLRPNSVDTLNNLGLGLMAQGKLDEAVASYQQALRLNPPTAVLDRIQRNLGNALWEQGKLDEAAASYGEALRINPTQRLRFMLATLLPRIYQSLDEVQHRRRTLLANLERLRQDRITFDLTNEASSPLFLLGYQGLNDRDIHRDFARLHVAPRETYARHDPVQRSQDSRIKIGFVSNFFKNHTIGRLAQGLLARLSRDDFLVAVFSVGSHADDLAGAIRRSADVYVELPGDLPSARRAIAEQGLDILFYTDIGIAGFTYSLAFSRLAPVQCVTWGHPITTGIDTIDYFISCEDLETSASAEHYTETLVRLKTLPIYYYRPRPPASLKGRSAFGLPGEGHLYGCPQSLFKIHPKFDPLLGEILRRDPRGRLVFLHARYRHWGELLLKRFRATIPDVADRIHFVPPLDNEHFLNLNALFDVLLDPIHFGGGNTTYEGLALGVPIVTLPSTFLRGRISWTLYQQMNVLDCVVNSPEEYVDLAVRLGTDRDYRAAMSARIRAANAVLFENCDGVRELEQFFKQAVTLEAQRRR